MNLLKIFTNYSDKINWLKSNYFVEKVIETENVKNLKYLLEHPKIKDKFDIDTFGSYFSILMSKNENENENVQKMLDYLVFDYVVKFNGLRDMYVALEKKLNANQSQIVKIKKTKI